MNINLKLRISTLLLVVVAASMTSLQLRAQVTVGSDIPPAKAAILEIKTEQSATDPTTVDNINNITSAIGGGGLGLPRVKLEEKDQLKPFIASATGPERLRHAGLMVYNINISPNTVTDLNKKFKLGVYVWDGAKWSLVGEGVGQRYFYLPSFNIKLNATKLNPVPGGPVVPPLDPSNPTATEPFGYDLYAEYRRQFTDDNIDVDEDGIPIRNETFVSSNPAITRIPSPENNQLYKRDELEYVITYYDNNILDGIMVTDEGKMYYYVKSLDTTPDSFLNVVFIIKE